MRHYTIAFCGFVLLAVCGTRVLRAEVVHAAASPISQSASIHLPLVLAHGAQGHEEAEGEGPQGGWQHFVSWIGHFHPPLTVFPIAMLLSAALAEILRIWSKASWLGGASRWCMIIGGVAAPVTALLGWAFAVDHGGSWILQVHRWLGTAAGAGAVVLLILSELAWRRGDGLLTLFRTVLFLAVPLVMATGFLGGAMVYGIHEYDWSRPADQHTEASESSQSPADAGTGEPSNSGPTEITMTDDATFKPDQVTIPAGTTIRWKNTSKDAHTVTDDPHVASDARAYDPGHLPVRLRAARRHGYEGESDRQSRRRLTGDRSRALEHVESAAWFRPPHAPPRASEVLEAAQGDSSRVTHFRCIMRVPANNRTAPPMRHQLSRICGTPSQPNWSSMAAAVSCPNTVAAMIAAAPTRGSAIIDTTVKMLMAAATHTHHGAVATPVIRPRPSHPVAASNPSTTLPTNSATAAASTGDRTACSIRLFAATWTGMTAPPSTTRTRIRYRIDCLSASEGQPPPTAAA